MWAEILCGPAYSQLRYVESDQYLFICPFFHLFRSHPQDGTDLVAPLACRSLELWPRVALPHQTNIMRTLETC